MEGVFHSASLLLPLQQFPKTRLLMQGLLTIITHALLAEGPVSPRGKQTACDITSEIRQAAKTTLQR